ncbi:MAG TPA: hypothetical protein VMT29_18605 [Steroidobacteraceae bacterium]|nr:hypothetical protein [Steroidobacteraceae bacterium]
MQMTSLQLRSPRKWVVIASALMSGGLGGCATDRLEASAPPSVNLTGDWKLNLNLSDDLDRLGEADKDQPRGSPGMGRRRGHAGPGGGSGPGGSGLPPIGASSNWMGGAPTLGGASATDLDPSAKPPPDGPPPGDSTSSGPPRSGGVAGGSSGGKSALSRALQAPDYLSIRQDGATVNVRFNAPDGSVVEDQFKAGTQTTIPYGNDSTADRTSGWRGPVFVVTTKAKKGGMREDDYALDEDGHLIVSTYIKGGHRGSIDVKRVYDRLKG